jgi:hypothetical protein
VIPEIKAVSVDDFIGKYVDRALSLDVSKTSTGLTIFENGRTKPYCLKLETDDNTAKYPVGERMLELREAIVDIVGENTHFDLICVEEAILGVNAKVSGVAYALNFVIDMLILDGIITCDNFMRINNKSWKAIMRKHTGVIPLKSGSDKDKKDIINYFQALNYSMGYQVNSFKSWSAYMKSGIQDMLDSVGVMYGSVEKVFREPNRSTKKVRKTQKVFDNLEDAVKYAKFRIKEVSITPEKLLPWFDDLKFVTDESTSYIVKTDSLGRFGIVKGYLHDYETYYLVVNVKLV